MNIFVKNENADNYFHIHAETKPDNHKKEELMYDENALLSPCKLIGYKFLTIQRQILTDIYIHNRLK